MGHSSSIRNFDLARRFLFALLIFATASSIAPAGAAQITIVAVGASNTYGKGVARGADFPAQLQAMLRARGYDARVINAGINGDTTAGMRARLSSAVPAGTQLVILQPGGNDRRKGIAAGREGNIAGIVAALNARKIKVITIERILSGLEQHLQPDGQHLTAQGYGIVAERLVPQVVAAIRK